MRVTVRVSGCDRCCRCSLRLIRRVAGCAASVLDVPHLELLEAVVAGARRRGTGVKVGVLVERHNSVGVGVAEDVTTSAAVVASCEVVEVALAGRVIANGRFGIGLPVLTGWYGGDLGEKVQIPFTVETLAAIAGGAAG